MPIPEREDNLQRLSAKNIIYQTVCDWIITGVLQPGEKLVDTELAKHFHVSRTPVREAFQMLETQKLLQVTPGRATVVSDIDMADIEKCYRPLADIQRLAVELACQRFSPGELEELEMTHALFTRACEENSAEEAITQDSRFHEIILRAAANEYIEEFSHTLILHIQRIKYHYFHCDRMRKMSVTHHGDILQALRERDAKQAGQLMRDHWLYVMERCLRDVMEDANRPNVRDDRGGLTE